MSVVSYILLGLLAAPVVLVGIAVVGMKLERRRLVAAVRAQGCPVCGAALLEGAVSAAEELWHRHVAAIMARNPGVRFRMGSRVIDAVCGACAARLRLDRGSGKLEPVTMRLAFESGDADELVDNAAIRGQAFRR